jgi:glycerol-1-phosphate dehydrogenase [NAD(P)+]
MVASSPRVLAAAPREMTASGLGDVLAKSVSSADWYCNHRLFGDYFCPRAAGLIEQIEPLYLARPADLPAGKPEAIEPLFWALLLTGVAMTMAGTSAPASGGEHLISHWLDMTAMRDGASHDLHGRQVGVGTILTSELYRRVLACDSPKLAPPAQTIDTADWGHASPAIQAEYARKLPRLLEAREKLAAGNAWDDLRQSLQPMVRKPEIIRDCLAAAKAAHKAEHIGCDRPRLLAALLRAHEIRSRFTILDLAYLAGVLPGQAQEIVEGWA